MYQNVKEANFIFYHSPSVTDDTLPDSINCSSQPTIAPSPETTTTNTYVIPAASAVSGTVLLVVTIVVLVLVAKRMCKYSSFPKGEDREQLLSNLTEDPGYGEYAFLHRYMYNVCMTLCMYICLFVGCCLATKSFELDNTE